MSNSRLVVVSNRLPVTVHPSGNSLVLQKSSGGLVTALEPLLRRTGGCWIGWPGMENTTEVSQSIQAACDGFYDMRPVAMTAEEHNEFYGGCANEILWPLFHDMASVCQFEPRYWETYRHVTEHFADAIELTATPRDFVWVHDHHLMLVADALRERDVRLKLAYFHHVPFPAPECFGRLPWRVEVLNALLQYNQLGFQTHRDRQNFIASLERWLPGEVHIERIDSKWLVEANGHRCSVGDFPISIDFEYFSDLARSPEVIAEAHELKQKIPRQSIVLGVDRLDYTKGIPERLKAFGRFLEQNPEMCGRATLVQLVVPSREDVPSYKVLRRTIEQSVSEINGRFGRPGWTPVIYMYRSVTPRELVALYRAADAALVTPLRDGLNLVAKEFCASHNDNSGVLILSEFAGAAEELGQGAILVNPHDVQQMADAIRVGIQMPVNEKSRRMTEMRSVIRNHDIWHWCSKFCSANVHVPSQEKRFPEVRTALRGAFVATASSDQGRIRNTDPLYS